MNLINQIAKISKEKDIHISLSIGCDDRMTIYATDVEANKSDFTVISSRTSGDFILSSINDTIRRVKNLAKK